MSRFDDTENALIARLRALKAKPDVTINLLDVIERLGVDGFTPAEIKEVLRALEQDGVIAFATANRILMLKALA
jgi:DNA-binding transcriptional MerR regulator